VLHRFAAAAGQAALLAFAQVVVALLAGLFADEALRALVCGAFASTCCARRAMRARCKLVFGLAAYKLK